MLEINKSEIKASDSIEAHGTLFTVHSMKSKNAKKSVDKIIKDLILSNIDSFKKASLSA